MFFPITSVALIVCLYRARGHGGSPSALLLALCAWAVGIVLMSAPIFDYGVAYSLRADLFVAASLVATTVVYLLVRQPAQAVPVNYWNRDRELFLAKLLGVAGIIGCMALVIDAGGSISASYLIENLAAIRQENFANVEDPAAGSKVIFLASILASCSVLSVIAAARFGRSAGWTLLALGVTNFLLLGIVGLLVYGGRTYLFYAIGLVLISFYLAGRRFSLSPRATMATTLLLIGVWYFGTSFVQTRADGALPPEATLADTQRATYRDWVAPIARSNDTVGTAVFSLAYLSSPLPTLAFYIGEDETPGPFWGRYSYPVPAIVVDKISGNTEPRPWIDVRHEVFSPLEAAGYFGNVWATWLRDLLVDFGYAGAFVFCCLFGAFMAWARNQYERHGALHYHCLEVLACFAFAYGAFAGILFLTVLAAAFSIAVGLMLAVRFTFARDVTTQTARSAVMK